MHGWLPTPSAQGTSPPSRRLRRRRSSPSRQLSSQRLIDRLDCGLPSERWRSFQRVARRYRAYEVAAPIWKSALLSYRQALTKHIGDLISFSALCFSAVEDIDEIAALPRPLDGRVASGRPCGNMLHDHGRRRPSPASSQINGQAPDRRAYVTKRVCDDHASMSVFFGQILNTSSSTCRTLFLEARPDRASPVEQRLRTYFDMPTSPAS